MAKRSNIVRVSLKTLPLPKTIAEVNETHMADMEMDIEKENKADDDESNLPSSQDTIIGEVRKRSSVAVLRRDGRKTKVVLDSKKPRPRRVQQKTSDLLPQRDEQIETAAALEPDQQQVEQQVEAADSEPQENAQEEILDQEHEDPQLDLAVGKSHLLARAIEKDKGRKTVLKRLWDDRQEVVQKCSVNELRRALYSPSVYLFPEGLRLLAYFIIEKIGIRAAGILIKKMMLEDHNKAHCNRVGNVIMLAWRGAVKKADLALQMEIEEDLIKEFAHAAVFAPELISTKFQHMMGAISEHSKTEKDKFNSMIFRCLKPMLWRGIQANNEFIQYQAFSLFLDFYPLIDDDEDTRPHSMQQQHDCLKKMMLHDSVPIRIIAADKILKLISLYHSFIPRYIIDDFLETITDKLSHDKIATVRHAVLEGLQYILPEPALVSQNFNILKCIIPHAVLDDSAQVRLAAFKRLREAQKNKFINFGEIMTIEDITIALELETNDSVRNEIVHLIFKTYFNNTKKVYRLETLADSGRNAALTFYRLIFPLNLVTVADAAKQVQFMILYVYKKTKKERNDTMSDTMMETGDMDETVGTLTGPSQDDTILAEGSKEFIRIKIIIECMLLLWMSMRKELMKNEHSNYRCILDAINTKLFKKLFQCYRNTSLIGTTMLLGSLLPQSSLDGVSHSVLNLLNEKIVDESVLEPYLEATAQWNIEHLFEIISVGLSDMHKCIENASAPTSPIRKKGKKSAKQDLSPADRFRKALYYLRYLLTSYSTNQLVTFHHPFKLYQFYKILCSLRDVIEARLEKVSVVTIPDDTIVEAFEIKQILSVFVVNCKARGDDETETENRFIREACEELAWFENNVVSKMALLARDNRMQFLIAISQKLLKSVSITMKSWSFNDEETIQEEYEGDEAIPSFKERAASLLLSYCKGSAPSTFIPLVIDATKELLNQMHEENNTSRTCLNYVLSVIDSIPSWVIGRFDAGEVDMNEKDVAESYQGLWNCVIKNSKYPRYYIPIQIADAIRLLIIHLSDICTQTQIIGDPRSLNFEVTLPIRIILSRTLFKNSKLSKMFLEELRRWISSNNLFEDNDEDTMSIDEKLIRMASIAQIVYLYNDKFHSKSKSEKKDDESEPVGYDDDMKEMLSMINAKVKEIASTPPDDQIILSQVNELLTQ